MFLQNPITEICPQKRLHAVRFCLLPFVFFSFLLPACGKTNGSTLDVTGQIESRAVTAGSRVGGRVVQVPVEEGASVHQGDLLIHLDDAEALAAVAAAEARVAQAQAALDKLRAGATREELAQAEAALHAAEEKYALARAGSRGQEKKAAQAAVAAATAERDAAQDDYSRARALRGEIVPQQTFDRAEATLRTAEARLRSARAEAGMVEEGARAQEIAFAEAERDRASAALDEMRRGAREEDLAAAQAAVDAANAALAQAQVNLRETRVLAPIDAIVESLDIRPGDLLAAGPAVRLVDPEDLELVVYVSAPTLGLLRVGERVGFTTDAHGPESFEGSIKQIAAEGEYTPRNLQTEEERVQQVFAVTLGLNSAGGKLRAGMTATVHFPESPGAATP